MICLIFTRRGPVQGPFQTATQFCSLLFLQLPQSSRDILIVEIRWVLKCVQKLLELGGGGKAGDIMDERDSTDEIAVGDIGKCRQVCLVTTLFGDRAAGANISSDLLIFLVRGCTCLIPTAISTTCLTWSFRPGTYGSKCLPFLIRKDRRPRC